MPTAKKPAASAAPETPNPWGDLKPIEVHSSFMKFEKIYDGVSGTVIDIQHEVPGNKFDFDSDQFELIATHGFYHNKDGSKVEFETGSRVIVPIKHNPKTSATKKARTLKIGQVVTFVFTEKIDTGKGNEFKNIEVYSDGTFDEDWLKENRPSPLKGAQEFFGGEVV